MRAPAGIAEEPAAAPGSAAVECPRRMEAAARLGTERRRLFLVGTAVSLAAPLLLYLTGAWETAWYALAATWLPLGLRAGLFIVGAHLALAIVALPLAYYGGFTLPRAYGLSRQDWRGWAVDWAKATLLAAGVGGLGGGGYLWSVLTFDAAWWWVFGVLLSAATVLLVFVTPYVLVPLFFKMQPLEDAATVERMRALFQRAGAELREVCSLDFSRRTAEANAAVIGFGRSRRVVLADTLLAEFAPREVDAVVAHELGHHVHRDVARLLLVMLGVEWLGLWLGSLAMPWALPALSVPYLAYVPAYPVLFAVAEAYLLVLTPATAWWSRRLETAADRFSLRLTGDPAAFASAMRRLACQNLVELQPPRWAEVLLGTHPALARRIALAEAESC